MNDEQLLASLKEYGADIDVALDRFMDDVELYRRCLKSFINDKNLDLLDVSLRDKDCKKAFFASHTLKGVAGNLGLGPMYDAIDDVVEPLRGGRCEGLEVEYEIMLKELARLKAAAGDDL